MSPIRTHSLSRILTAVVATVTTAVGVAQLPAAAQTAGAPDLAAPYAWVEEFDSPDVLDDWNVFNQPDYGYADALYTSDAIEITDGQLIITTRRHCVDEDIDLSDWANHALLTEENVSVEPCGEDQFQKFTSGRLQGPDIARGEFKLSVTATFDTGGVNGVRSAIWMQNEHAACSAGDPASLYGELDLIEHFSHDSRAPWSPSNTHLGCNPWGQNGTNNAPRELRLGESVAGVQHTWTTATSRSQVAYFIDDRPIDRQSWNNGKALGHATVSDFGLSQGTYDRILDQNWKLILNQKVENAAWTHPRGADEDFPVRAMTVDRIEVSGRPFDEIAPLRDRGPELSSGLSSGMSSGLS